MNNPPVLIRGALTGIGRAAAVAFAKKGAKVVVAGRRDGKALVAAAHPEGSTDPVPRRQSRLAVPVSRTLRPECPHVPSGAGPRRVNMRLVNPTKG
jgi:NAD(P)-dependent dehydrogenase (short-subunit alcohol dehydrogenase family)